MNLFEKINAVMKEVEYLTKDSKIEFGKTRYKAISEEKVTSTVRDKLTKYGIVLYPTEISWTRIGDIAHVDVLYKMVNAENPEESIQIASCGDGYDSQDKGSGKAMTYAYKYALLRTFSIPTGEDPDKVSTEEIEDSIRKKGLAEQWEIDTLKQYLTKEQWERTIKNAGDPSTWTSDQVQNWIHKLKSGGEK